MNSRNTTCTNPTCGNPCVLMAVRCPELLTAPVHANIAQTCAAQAQAAQAAQATTTCNDTVKTVRRTCCGDGSCNTLQCNNAGCPEQLRNLLQTCPSALATLANDLQQNSITDLQQCMAEFTTSGSDDDQRPDDQRRPGGRGSQTRGSVGNVEEVPEPEPDKEGSSLPLLLGGLSVIAIAGAAYVKLGGKSQDSGEFAGFQFSVLTFLTPASPIREG